MKRTLLALVIGAALGAGAAFAGTPEEWAHCDACDVMVHCNSRVMEKGCPAKCSNGHVVRCRACNGI